MALCLNWEQYTSNDSAWLEYAEEQVKLETQNLLRGYGYEPEDALVYVLDGLFNELNIVSQPVVISIVKEHLKTEYDVQLKNYQIEEMCRKLGFKVTKPHGYPPVQPEKSCYKNCYPKLIQAGDFLGDI